jgi:hypothetical protein
MHGLLRIRCCAYLCDLQCGISDEMSFNAGVYLFCGRIRCLSRRVVLGENLRLRMAAEELLLLWIGARVVLKLSTKAMMEMEE